MFMFSSRETRRRDKTGMGEEAAMLAILLAVVTFVLLVWAALKVGSWWTGQAMSWNPFTALLSVASGQARWPWQSTPIAVLLSCTAGALAFRGMQVFGTDRRLVRTWGGGYL